MIVLRTSILSTSQPVTRLFSETEVMLPCRSLIGYLIRVENCVAMEKQEADHRSYYKGREHRLLSDISVGRIGSACLLPVGERLNKELVTDAAIGRELTR